MNPHAANSGHMPSQPPVSQSAETLPLVRDRVKRLLTRSKAYRALDKDKARQLANDMVKVSNYIVDANGETRDAPLSALITPAQPAGGLIGARQLADEAAPDTAGQDFSDQGGAVAAQSGGEALTDIIGKADFPGFVGGLIDGVFNAVVQASIDQMDAYATLLQNVAKSADEYMKDNISEDQARDALVERYPDHLQADFSGDTATVAVRQDADESNMPNFMKDLGLPFELDSIDDDTVEETLVPAQRKKMAIDRQQLLLSLVLMGINRIVVTDGKISASVVFTLDTTDAVTRHKERTSTFEYNSTYSRTSNPWFRPKTKFTSDTKLNIETANTEDSEASVKLKTTMKGAVDLRFRSETFPLEKIADIIGVNQQELSAPAPPAPQAAS